MDDFNNDRQVDIIGANTVAKNVAVLLGHKDGSFTIEATYQTGLSTYYVAMGDFNCDSRLDITVANEDDGNIGAIFGYVNFTFRNHATLLTGDRSRPSSFAIADLNHDQQKDIIVTNSESNSVGVFLGFGNGSFASRVTYSTGSYSYPRHVAIYDFNNDLLLDIAVANYSRNNIGILRGQGNGTFLETPHPFILFMKFFTKPSSSRHQFTAVIFIRRLKPLSTSATRELHTISRMQADTIELEIAITVTTLEENQQQPHTSINSCSSQLSDIENPALIHDSNPQEEEHAAQANHHRTNIKMDEEILKINTLSITFAGVFIALGGIILYFTRSFISSRLRYFLPIPPVGVAAYVFVFNMFKFYNASLPRFSAVVIEILLSTLTTALVFFLLVVLMVLIIWLIL
ncbi:unnamed protein product [Rotaria socialis]